MVRREGTGHPDVVSMEADRNRMLASVEIRIWSTSTRTYTELWAKTDPAGSRRRVAWTANPRVSEATPDVKVMAGYLARIVSHLDREGWESLI